MQSVQINKASPITRTPDTIIFGSYIVINPVDFLGSYKLLYLCK